MKAPGFWFSGSSSWQSLSLAPFSALYRAGGFIRMLKRPWQAGVPVLCCGNLTAGGTGKTILAIDLARRLQQQGVDVHFLTRGYRRKSTESLLRVDVRRHDAAAAGDEALLLAAVAPTWVCADRARAARAAIEAGAQYLIMDDGLQNPSLYQGIPLVVVDGAVGFGNGCTLPAGPLREPVGRGLRRAAAVVMIGRDLTGVRERVPRTVPLLQAYLAMNRSIRALKGCRVVAFAGIGRPSKFFDSLRAEGLVLSDAVEFDDHHFYQEHELEALLRQARAAHARLVTTAKDAVKLPPAFRSQVSVLGVHLRWAEPERVYDLLFSVYEHKP